MPRFSRGRDAPRQLDLCTGDRGPGVEHDPRRHAGVPYFVSHGRRLFCRLGMKRDRVRSGGREFRDAVLRVDAPQLDVDDRVGARLSRGGDDRGTCAWIN